MTRKLIQNVEEYIRANISLKESDKARLLNLLITLKQEMEMFSNAQSVAAKESNVFKISN